MKCTGTGSKTAMVINKDIKRLEFLSHLLQRTGLEPLPFTDAEIAMKALDKESPPSLIITDLYMPLIDGWKFCRMVRSPVFEPFNNIPVMVISSVFSEHTAIDIMSDLQADAFLPYPFEENHFIEQVKSLLEGKKPEKPSVIIVEHDKNLSSVIKNMFERHGFMVNTAMTACEAKEFFKKTSCHIALLNYNLPDRKGDTLLHNLSSQNPDCICLIMAEDISPELALKWMTDGAYFYLKKPFEPEQLMELCAGARREKVFIDARKILERKTDELHESEEKYGLAFEKASIGMCLVSIEGRILQVNEELCRIFGYSRHELEKMHVNDISVHEDKDTSPVFIREALEGIKTYGTFEKKYFHRKGHVVRCLVSSSIVRDIHGKPLYFISHVQDITESRLAQEKILHQKKVMEEAGRLALIGYWEWDLDRDIWSFSDTFLELHGSQRRELTSEELLPLAHPDDRALIRNAFDEVIRHGRPYDIEHRIIKQDTGEIRFLHSRGKLMVIDENSQSRKLVGACLDITEKKQTEESLRENERQIRQLIETIPNNLWTARPDGYIDYCNNRLLNHTGMTAEEFQGNGWVKALHPEDLSSTGQAWAEACRTGNIYEVEQRLRRFDGVYHWFLTRAVPARDEEGNIIKWYGSNTDITERKKNEELIKKSEKRFKFMVEKLQAGAVYVEEDRVFLNREAERITGYKAEEIKTVEEWFRKLYKEKAREIRMLYETDKTEEFPSRTVEILTKKNEIRFIEFFSYAEQDRAIWLMYDITDRKKTEEALRKSEKELQWILKSMLNAFVLFESVFDDKGNFISYRFVYINDSYEKITGVKNQEVKGKTVHEVWPGTEDEWVKRYGEVAVSGISQTFDMYHSPTEKLYHCNVYRPWDTKERFCVIFEDITEKKKTEEALKESEKKFRSYIENAPEGIFLADERGKYLLVNDAACRMTGFTGEELLEKNLTELTHPDDITVAMEHFRKVVTSGKASGEGRFVTKSGEVRHWIVKAVKLNEKNVLGFAADITERRITEEALKESEARLKKVLEILPAGVWITDKHGKIIQSNPAAEEIWAGAKYVGPEEFYEYKGWWYDTKKLIKPEEWAASRAIRKGEISREELIEIECFDGTHKIILNWAMPFTGANQEIEGAIAVNQDITERKLMEENLKSAYSKLQALWGVSSMADSDIKTISDHILSTIAKMTGSDYGFYGFINEDESVMTIHSWSGEAMKDCSMVDKPSHFPVEKAGIWAEAIRQRKPFILHDYNEDHRGKKGIPEGHVNITNLLSVPFFSHGKITSVAAVANRPLPYSMEDIEQITSFLTGIQSIMEHKKTEEYIRLMADMLDEAPGIITVHDFNGKFLYGNRKTFELHGYSREEFMELEVKDVDVPESTALFKERIEHINRYGEASFDVYHIKKDGTILPLNVFAKKVMWKDIPATLSIATDMTERKRAEEEKERLQAQLLQAQKMESVGRLAGGVAHDFNNMLGIILGFAELSLEEIKEGHMLYDSLKGIEKAAIRSADLTRQLLAFARKQTISPKVLDLNDTVSGTLRMIRRLIGEDIDLAWMPGANLLPVMVDPSQIDQILANLCVNARDAIKGVGKVTIETENVNFDSNYSASHTDFIPGEYVMLSVSDNGSGMDKDTIEHIFEPFFTTKETGKGTGLGLATVYGIVRQNNGFINVYSEPGMGSNFKIYIPRFSGNNIESDDTVRAEIIEKGSETVLLVEDEQEMMDMIKIMLERLGYRVLPAPTPEKAISMAEDYSGEIHLLITDVVMPEMNGRHLAEKLMSIYSNMKCLFMSGYTANVIAHHGVLEEGLMFIEKPFTRKDLAGKVRKALEQD